MTAENAVANPTRHAGGRPRRYPWDLWLPKRGRVPRTVLRPGVDYDIDSYSMRSSIIVAAKRRGVEAHTMMLTDGIIINPTAQDRARADAPTIGRPTAHPYAEWFASGEAYLDREQYSTSTKKMMEAIRGQARRQQVAVDLMSNQFGAIRILSCRKCAATQGDYCAGHRSGLS